MRKEMFVYIQIGTAIYLANIIVKDFLTSVKFCGEYFSL